MKVIELNIAQKEMPALFNALFFCLFPFREKKSRYENVLHVEKGGENIYFVRTDGKRLHVAVMRDLLDMPFEHNGNYKFVVNKSRITLKPVELENRLVPWQEVLCKADALWPVPKTIGWLSLFDYRHGYTIVENSISNLLYSLAHNNICLNHQYVSDMLAGGLLSNWHIWQKDFTENHDKTFADATDIDTWDDVQRETYRAMKKLFAGPVLFKANDAVNLCGPGAQLNCVIMPMRTAVEQLEHPFMQKESLQRLVERFENDDEPKFSVEEKLCAYFNIPKRE